MHVLDRPVSFEDVDAAGIVFFPKVLAYCHDAMADLMGKLPGGYAGLVVGRRVGLPTVHVEVDFVAPLRFGDVARVTLSVGRIGRSSVAFEVEVASASDDTARARVKLVCVCTDLGALRSVAWPDDVRTLLERHLAG